MAGCCCSCSRPLILSDDEACLLRSAAAGPVPVAEDRRECARALKRLGYLERVGEGLYAITDYGRRRLAELMGEAPAGEPTVGCPPPPAHCGGRPPLTSS